MEKSRLLRNSGNEAFKGGKTREALGLYDKAIEELTLDESLMNIDPQDVQQLSKTKFDAWQRLQSSVPCLLNKVRTLTEAAGHLCSSHNPGVLVQAQCHLDLSETDKALRTLDTVLAFDPANIKVRAPHRRGHRDKPAASICCFRGSPL